MVDKKDKIPDYIDAQAYPIPAELMEHIRENSIVTRSPGRINLIGEHTDYNNGFVLPAAIDKAAYLVLTPRNDKTIKLRSIDLDQHYETNVDEIRRSEKESWPNYILGVVEQFVRSGITVRGFDGHLTGDIPIGAGLSSSAAVECAVALALNIYTGSKLDRMQLVKMSQKAENVFVGVQCGIMDQFASMFGQHDHVIRLDCRSLEFEYLPLSMAGIKILLLDTGVRHSLGDTAYNERRQQCEQGVAWVREHVDAVESLRDVTREMLSAYVLPKDPLIFRRCSYVVDENARLLAACDALAAGDLHGFGKQMYGSHKGLSHEYEVSCAELDFLVEQVRENPDVLGARMMGGGFGGCTINLVKEAAIPGLIEKLTAAYKSGMGKDLKAYIAQIETGSNALRKPG